MTNNPSELREKLIVEVTTLKAATANSYTHFHGQEEGEDPLMDKYWEQEKEAEQALYAKLDALIQQEVKAAKDELQIQHAAELSALDQQIMSLKAARIDELEKLHRYDGKDYDTELDEIIDERIEALKGLEEDD